MSVVLTAAAAYDQVLSKGFRGVHLTGLAPILGLGVTQGRHLSMHEMFETCVSGCGASFFVT